MKKNPVFYFLLFKAKFKSASPRHSEPRSQVQSSEHDGRAQLIAGFLNSAWGQGYTVWPTRAQEKKSPRAAPWGGAATIFTPRQVACRNIYIYTMHCCSFYLLKRVASVIICHLLLDGEHLFYFFFNQKLKKKSSSFFLNKSFRNKNFSSLCTRSTKARTTIQARSNE